MKIKCVRKIFITMFQCKCRTFIHVMCPFPGAFRLAKKVSGGKFGQDELVAANFFSFFFLKKVHLKRKDYNSVSLFVVTVTPSFNTVAWTPAVSA